MLPALLQLLPHLLQLLLLDCIKPRSQGHQQLESMAQGACALGLHGAWQLEVSMWPESIMASYGWDLAGATSTLCNQFCHKSPALTNNMWSTSIV